jgi:hypothetical protein
MTAQGNRRLRDLTHARRLRTRCFALLTRSTDLYLRSPLFLIWMRYSLSAASELQALQAEGLSSLLPRKLPRLPRPPAPLRAISSPRS